MSNDEKIPTPAFMFGRLRDIEIETGLLLAGMLVVDLPTDAKRKRRHQRMINEIIDGLTAMVQAGQMPEHGEVFGWRDGRRPDNADAFVKSEEAKTNWRLTHLTIAVRVDLRKDAKPRLDSDLKWRLGLIKDKERH
jgi:hypothetical protein